MSTKPILFNTDMVRAIQDGTKTVTRRVVKGASPEWDFVGIEERPYEQRIKADGEVYPKELDWPHAVFSAGDGYCDFPMIKAPYNPGDILYVRETWCWCPCWDCGMDTEEGCVDEIAERFYNDQKAEWGCYGYKASFAPNEAPFDRWHPSIHMPREAARIFLRVTAARVERLQDITDEQVRKEGCSFTISQAPYKAFELLWDSTIKPADRALYGWEANPWVWVIEFERIGKEAVFHEH